MNAKLVLEDGSELPGLAFGWPGSVAGEVVFNTGMVGYPESFTDPSYRGQILVLTYPLIGNYGVPPDAQTGGLPEYLESSRIQISGLVVSEFADHFSHWNGARSLDEWLKANQVPAITGLDTRMLTQRLRSRGAMLGRLIYDDQDVEPYDPNKENLVATVSIDQPKIFGDGEKTIVLMDCGCKNNIIRSLVKRGVTVKVVPWDWPAEKEKCDGVLVSNGPGDPIMAGKTVETIRKLLANETPIFGVCLGNQLLSLAAGAKTYKLKYGHRGQNQPCVQVGTKRCYITSQNHGYAVNEQTLPGGWQPWFFNANDGTNEGIRHATKPFFSVQFHPEATPGPVDTGFLFDKFLEML